MTTTRSTASAPTYGVTSSGFRLPGNTRVGGVRLQVADLPRSIAYYGDVMGLRVIRRRGPRRGGRRALMERHASGHGWSPDERPGAAHRRPEISHQDNHGDSSS